MTENEEFRITDDKTADWALRIIAEELAELWRRDRANAVLFDK